MFHKGKIAITKKDILGPTDREAAEATELEATLATLSPNLACDPDLALSTLMTLALT